MTKKILGLIIMATFVFSIILAGCSQKDTGKTDDKKKDEKAKDEIVLAFNSEPDA